MGILRRERSKPLAEGDRYALRERKKVPVAYCEVSPLLRGKRRKLLQCDEPILAPFVEYRSGAHHIGAAARAEERDRQEDTVADAEEFRIFGAVGRQSLAFDETAVPPFVDDGIDVTVASVYVGGLPRQVFGQLRHDQEQSAACDQRRHRTRPDVASRWTCCKCVQVIRSCQTHKSMLVVLISSA